MDSRRTPVVIAALLTATLAPPSYGVVDTGLGAGVGGGAATCHGRAATIVGRPDGEVVGTPGADVIVTRGARTILGEAGDDLICVSGHSTHTPTISAGAGDDLVDTTSADNALVQTHLGSGSDAFAGGSGRDAVYAGEFTHDDVETDTIATGAGDDVVHSGVIGSPNADVVRLGPGDDVLAYLGIQTGGLSIPGTGKDTVDINITGQGPASTRLDVRSSVVERNGVPVLRWHGLFAVYRIVGKASHGDTVMVTGSRAGETLVLDNGGTPRVTAHLHDGDDRIEAARLDYAGDSVFSAGPGTDTARLNLDGNDFSREPVLHVDLSEHRLDYGPPTGSPDARLDGIERVVAGARKLWVTGDRKDNQIRTTSCRAALVGGPGDDRLTSTSPGFCPAAGARLTGGSGDDRLRGGRFDDVLAGGAGRDVADGAGGVDTCRAEVTTRCELP